jgi:periplasmic divalent cation tolerance protein
MNSDSSAIAVFITAPTKAEADQIAEMLVDTKLAACVQILPEIESVYRWQGAIERQKEVLLIAKTTAGCFADLETRVRAIHSYDTPEIVATPLTSGSPAYFEWLKDSVRVDKQD